MNINDLMKFDLKKIDMKNIDLKSLNVATIQDFIIQKQSLVAQVFVVLVASFSLIALWFRFQEESRELKVEINVLQQKKEVINQFEKTSQDEKDFKKTLPQEIDEDQLSNQITDFAVQKNIAISSFSSNKSASDKFSESIKIRVSISANSYKDFLSFLQAIEASEFSFKVDACKLILNNNQERVQFKSELDIVYTILKK